MIIGSLTVFCAAMVGGTLAFLLGRYIFRDSVYEFAQKYRIFKAIDHAIEKEGLKMGLLLRLCPIMPFTMLNYVLSLTSMNLKHFVIAMLGAVPIFLVFIYIGTTLSSI